MFGRSTTDTKFTEASYGPKNRRKGNEFHIDSLNVRSISDQSKAEAFDLLAVNSGCKVIALQETKRKEGEWVLFSGVELICTRRETREGRLAFWIYKDGLGSLVETKYVLQRSEEGIHTTSVVGFVDHRLRRLQRHRGMLFGPSSICGRTLNWPKKRKRRSASELCVLQQSDNTQYDLPQTAQPKVDMDQPGRKGEKQNRLHPDKQARNCSRLRSILFRLTAKKEKSRKFAKTKRAGGERSWDPVRFKNTITEMLTENPQTCYEELTESIRSAASTATHATHQLSRISEVTKNLMLSRFQAIHTGQTKDADLAEINKEVRRSLENGLDKRREFQSLEAAMRGRSLKKMKRALTLKATPFTNLERPDGSTIYNHPEIRNRLSRK
uniref:Uncharacterized protein n=1 Tax=Caenorhabditis japonica TaxID=281687 RepID=A0A8R1I335_CAEJA